MKALSIKQPWAWLICAGYKDIENRPWKIGRNPRHGWSRSQTADFTVPLPMRIYVHASKKEDGQAGPFTSPVFGDSWERIWSEYFKYYRLNNSLGAIIGEIDIVDCVTESESPWFIGKYGFVLANPLLYKNPIPYRGQLGFFNVDIPTPSTV